ncbi:MAG: nucleotide exchange factor GrpE [Lentisphaerae bacterium]|nr:nucleotide exchange factor GrpE [Lentisphaerota bacterium]
MNTEEQKKENVEAETGAGSAAGAAPDGAPVESAGQHPAGREENAHHQHHDRGHKHGHHGKKDHKESSEAASLNERLLRLAADFDNFRKRTAREWDEVRRKANEDIILELLPVTDSLTLAIESANSGDTPAAFVEGVKLVLDRMNAVLAKFGVEPIEAVGKPFDPALHEAISVMAAPQTPENHVFAESRKGYMLGGHVLRASQVIVSSGPAPSSDGAGK